MAPMIVNPVLLNFFFLCFIISFLQEVPIALYKISNCLKKLVDIGTKIPKRFTLEIVLFTGEFNTIWKRNTTYICIHTTCNKINLLFCYHKINTPLLFYMHSNCIFFYLRVKLNWLVIKTILLLFSRQTTSDAIELSEASLDLNLSSANLRCKVAPGTPPLSSITVYERSASRDVVILAATVSSVHRLIFPHPGTLDKKVMHWFLNIVYYCF